MQVEIKSIIVSVVLGGLVWLVWELYTNLVLKPKKLRSKLQSQGIKGPPPSSFLYGNIPEIQKIHLQHRLPEMENSGDPIIDHDWTTKVFPHIDHWRNEYGKTFMYSTGNKQTLCITDPELAKEFCIHTSLNLGKPAYLLKDRGPLFGQGILTSNGAFWAYQRKIIAPEFYPEKVKDMVTLMANSAMTMILLWESKVRDGMGYAEIRVDDDLRSVSADIISRACFGSNYIQGERIFEKLRAVQTFMSKATVGVPGLRYLPNKNNREMWRLNREINSMILDVIKLRSQGTGERDLLQSIMEAAKRHGENGDSRINVNPRKFIVDNCKNIYFAGHETTATSAAWCLMLLAAHPEWQARARAEVLEVCGDKLPDASMLRSMKTLTMVIQETLRLYSPISFVVREALHDVHFKHTQIPKGTNLQIVQAILHRQPDVWGPDAHQFNPERFAEGSKGASRSTEIYMPFGAGPRICPGQNFAMAELKVILSLILSRFSFSLSPAYRHSPAFRLTIEPEHGLYLHVKKV